MKPTNFNMKPTPRKHLVITQEKDEGVKMVLSFGLGQNVSIELHMIMFEELIGGTKLEYCGK